MTEQQQPALPDEASAALKAREEACNKLIYKILEEHGCTLEVTMLMGSSLQRPSFAVTTVAKSQ